MNSHQMDLFSYSAAEPLPEVHQAPTPIIKAPAVAVPKDPNCEGYTNSATCSAALYLSNDAATYQHFEKLYISDNLTPAAISKHFQDAKMQLDAWAEGVVNWAEILLDFEEKFSDLVVAGIPNNALAVLSASVVRENTILLPCQLERGLYAEVKKLLDSMGGKWNKKAGGHLFPEDPSDQLEMVLLTGSVKKIDKFGFFPTPQPLAEAVVALAGIEEGMIVLEPSAGSGNLADVIAQFTSKVNIRCCELQRKNVVTLQEKGYRVVEEGNFLLSLPTPTFAVVVMNPPFEKQADIDHVLHAYKYLEPGGRLVSIMSASVTFRNNTKTCAFRETIEELGYYVENPPGSFKISGTNVNTITVVLNKPLSASVDEFAELERQAA